MKTIILYGYPAECEASEQYLKKNVKECMTQRFSEQEEMIPVLMETRPAAVWVIMEKAAGMEGVIAVRRIYPDLPVIWFSTDSGFAPQAYRLHVNYFTLMPVNEDKIMTALRKCKLNI